MHAWLEPVLFNVASATCLALLAALVGARARRPALAHALWLLVLLKLVSPPALEIALVPKLERWLPRAAHPNGTKAARAQEPVQVLGTASQPPSAPGFTYHAAPQSSSDLTGQAAPATSAFVRNPGNVLPIALAAGAILVLGMSGLRIARFRRRLARASADAPTLQKRADELARTLGASRAPRLRLVSAPIAPSLWLRPGACEILFPAALLPRLSPNERDMLIAHELAHVRRRDHWVRPVEMLVMALYWWLPLAWWARRKLRDAEESSCDALVLARLPGRSRTYAEALLKTLEFLATRSQRVPALGTGAGTTNQLEARMTMILKHKPARPLPPRFRPLLLATAALALLVSPAWVEKPATAADPEVDARGEVAKLQREELRLQKQLRELEVRRMQIQRQLEEAMLKQERAQMLLELQTLESEGMRAEADELRARLATMEKETAWRRNQATFEAEQSAQRMHLEFQLQELALQLDSLQTRGDETSARTTRERMLKLELELRRLELRGMQQEIDRSEALLELEREQLQGSGNKQ